MSPSRKSPYAEANEQIDQLQQLDGAQREAHALQIIGTSRNLQVIQAALAVLKEDPHPDLRLPLIARFEKAESRNDPSGYIRAGVLGVLKHIIRTEDVPLLDRALQTYEYQGMYELCAGVRAAALLCFLELDTDLAVYHASRLLADPQNSFSEEPAMTAVQVLISCSALSPLFAFASWSGRGSGAVTGEVLRNLTGLPGELIPYLISAHIESEDEQVLLGLFDLLLGHPRREQWRSDVQTFMETTELIDLYGIIAMQIVASRDDVLIDGLRDLLERGVSRDREYLLESALRHA